MFNLIIIVDDGSSDASIIKINNFIHKNLSKNITVLSNKQNQGKGYSIKKGFSYILNVHRKFPLDSIVVLLDGDDQMDINKLPDLIFPLIKHQSYQAIITKASRMSNKAYYDAMPKFRYFGNQTLKVLNWISSGQWNITDPQNGYVSFELNLLYKIEVNNLANSYYFENSFLNETRINRQKIIEIQVPSRYNIGEVSSINYLTFIPKTSIDLLYNWLIRIVISRNQNILRKLSYYLIILSAILIMSVLFSHLFYFVTFNMNLIFSLTLISLFLLHLIFEFLDFKNL